MMRVQFSKTIPLFLVVLLTLPSFAVQHPHMIIKKTEYPALLQRAKHWPWSVMKNKAIDDARDLEYSAELSYGSACDLVHELAGALALAYILDPENRGDYVDKVETHLTPAMTRIQTEKGTRTSHGYSVRPAHAAFMMYLLLDIMHDALSKDSLYSMEQSCDFIAAHHRPGSWELSKYSIAGMKELYHHGATPHFETIKDEYKTYLQNLTSDDGVFTTGPGYAVSRLYMDGRMQKKIFLDICEYQGYHEFYSNPVFIDLHEWLFGYAVTPFNRTYTFGDSPPSKSLDHWSVAALRAGRFSDRAKAYAGHFLGPLTDEKLEGRLMHYLMCDHETQTSFPPLSRIFENGGAWLLEDSASNQAMAGVLWNVNTVEKSHKHFDVNAIHIAAYGEHMLRNAGYSGYGRPDSTTWKWIQRTAESSNTVMINRENHRSWQGGGILEGLLHKDLQYISAHSGDALDSAEHVRNFFFFKPNQDVKNGYFVIVDEIVASDRHKPDVTVNISWHPNASTSPVVIQGKMEYHWKIKECDLGDSVGVSIFLATLPADVSLKEGYLGSYDECSRYMGKYMFNTFLCNDHRASVVTVMTPFDVDHEVPKMNRIHLNETSGACIVQGKGIKDYIVSTSVPENTTLDNITFNGRVVNWRKNEENVIHYFTRKGTLFADSQKVHGFASKRPVSMSMKGNTGQIISPGTRVKFYGKKIKGIILNDDKLALADSGENFVQVYIDPGKYDIRLVH
ncbi:hypothetical protein GF406_08315 [candidate division KSB1 bacterium]|nr:hypothetical protein [candidate division KSB1 bacterium]